MKGQSRSRPDFIWSVKTSNHYSPIDSICLHPGKPVLIDLQHELKATRHALDILRTLWRIEEEFYWNTAMSLSFAIKKKNIVRESSTMGSIWNTKQIQHTKTGQSKTCTTVAYQTRGSPHAGQEYYTPTHARSQSSSTLPSHLSRNLRLEREGGWEEETIC